MPESYRIGVGKDDKESRAAADDDSVSFWEEQSGRLYWFKKWDKPIEWNEPFVKWFVGGKINACYNALDIHQAERRDKTAIIWEGEDGKSKKLTYGEIFTQVKKLSNTLKGMGVSKGDRVTIYLPMIPEMVVSVLACARIGAVHTVVFSGFSSKSLRDRIEDSESKVVITADGGYRRGKVIPLKETVDKAVSGLDFVKKVIVVSRIGDGVKMGDKDVEWEDLLSKASDECEAEEVEGPDPLFILYTSGTTGKPKGVVHDTGGYLTHVHRTFEWAFDIKDTDVYFCMADVGWVTGHSYVIYAPMMHGATQVIFEGAPDYPDTARMWKIIEKNNVTIFYSTPTAIRMFIKFGDDVPKSCDLTSLRILGTVGEPINPDVWKWYFDVIGGGRCPVVDTWWQTETGGFMISPLPGLETRDLKPGSATVPIPGVDVKVVDESGKELPPGERGHMVITKPWPGMLSGLWKNDDKYREVYWSKFPGTYYTGDYSMRDEDGYFWMDGRADDVMNISGHMIGTAEVESNFVSHKSVAEAAVCSIPHSIKGECMISFLVLKDGVEANESIRSEVISHIRETIGPVATPEQIFFVSKLPKTRSGKIMRRLLRSIAKKEELGDLSTIEDGASVSEIESAIKELKESLKQN